MVKVVFNRVDVCCKRWVVLGAKGNVLRGHEPSRWPRKRGCSAGRPCRRAGGLPDCLTCRTQSNFVAHGWGREQLPPTSFDPTTTKSTPASNHNLNCSTTVRPQALNLYVAAACSPCTAMGPDEKPVVLKAPLAKMIIRNPNHLTIYQNRVNRVNCLVTAAYLFSRYIFIHSYDNYDDDDAFNPDIFMTDSFFMEILRSLQTRTR